MAAGGRRTLTSVGIEASILDDRGAPGSTWLAAGGESGIAEVEKRGIVRFALV